MASSFATDAYTRSWEPSAKPFMTLILTFEDLGGGKTRYTARARHWSEADREAHEKMGFAERPGARGIPGPGDMMKWSSVPR